jgi:HEAT repeat protein
MRLDDDEVRIKLGTIRVVALLDPEALGVAHLASAVAAAAPGSGSQTAAMDAEGTAVLAAKALRVRGHLHEDQLRTTIVPLLSHPTWQVRRAAVRVLSIGGSLSPELALRVRSDGSPLVRQAAQAD